jgi:chemotaxis protein MotA
MESKQVEGDAMRLSLGTIMGIVLNGAVMAWGILIVLNVLVVELPPLLVSLNLPSLAIVLGGIGIHALISYPLSDYLKSWAALPGIFSHAAVTTKTAEDDLSRLVNWQKEFINDQNAAENLSRKLEGSYEGYVLMLLASGYSNDQVRSMAEVRAATMQRSRMDASRVLYTMGNASPAFGMLGTLFGLIVMLTNFEQATELAKGLSVALMTTVYGLVFAQMVFLPMGQKLQQISMQEYDRHILMLDSLLLIRTNTSVLELYDRFKAYTLHKSRGNGLPVNGRAGFANPTVSS